jgi:3-oxoacyl-ACP reductase-like protein
MQSGSPTAPPNFYAQAATAQPVAAGQPAAAEDTKKFRTAMEKLLMIFDKMEKLKPNGIDVSKKIKSVADSLKDLRNEVFEGEESEGGDGTDTDIGSSAAAGNAAAGASPPPPLAATGGVAGTGA